MIDLRSHILDSTPCGPGTFAESLEMCRAAITDGVRTIVATPRWEAGRPEPPLPFDECRRRLERLQEETQGGLSLNLGFALQFSPDLPALVERHGSKLALAGKRHLLVSLPSVEVPVRTEEVWKELAGAGFSIVLSHPECNAALRRDPNRLARWVSGGITLQLDAASLAGTYGRDVQRFAMECAARYHSAAVVASNLRSPVSAGARLPSAYRALASRFGAGRASELVIQNPAALLSRTVSRNSCPGVSRQPTRSFATLLRFVGYKAS